MKLGACLLVACAALAGVVAADAGATRHVATGGPVVAVGTTAAEVVYAVRVTPLCSEVRVWDTGDRGVRRYARRCFQGTSTGSGIAAVAVSQRRALWLEYTGGNIREWMLWTKTRTSQPTRLAFEARDVDGPPPLVVGSAWEGSLPWALDETVVVLRPDGSRRFSLRAPARVLALSAHSRGYAAVLANGNVLTISSAGRALREHVFTEPVQAAVLAGPGLVAATRSGIEIRNGAAVRTFPLPAGARFLGFSEGLVAYGTGRQLRLLRVSDGRDRLFRTLAVRFPAQLGRRGLGYGSGSRVSFDAWSTVAAAAGR
jgi:hypothetical protein